MRLASWLFNASPARPRNTSPSFVEPLEGRQLLSGVTPACPGAATDSLQTAIHQSLSRKKPVTLSFVGTFAGKGSTVTGTKVHTDPKLKIQITSYTPAANGAPGTVSGTITTQYGTTSFNGQCTPNPDGGFFFASSPIPDPEVNPGPNLQLYVSMVPGKGVAGGFNGDFGSTSVSEVFSLLKPSKR